MTAYRIRACMGGQALDEIINAPDFKTAALELSEKVNQGLVEIIDDGFTGNKRVHITYEEVK
jgi:hypothetical protein|tara:strand:- start:149 stop:334 length:186 start_codon:yes stop_codon:yes gene_type:complete